MILYIVGYGIMIPITEQVQAVCRVNLLFNATSQRLTLQDDMQISRASKASVECTGLIAWNECSSSLAGSVHRADLPQTREEASPPAATAFKLSLGSNGVHASTGPDASSTWRPSKHWNIMAARYGNIVRRARLVRG